MQAQEKYKDIDVAIIGLDTSHSIEFSRRMLKDCPDELRVQGLRAVSCLRFKTPFIDNENLDKRQQQLESWGVKVTEDFNKAVKDCDAIMIEINDPEYHYEYFKKCAYLGKPIFIDKPLADNYANGKRIYDLAKENNIKVISASSLRYSQSLIDACNKVPEVTDAYVYGPAGGIVWYGVHCFEMLQRIMGFGFESITTVKSDKGVVCVVDYANNSRGIVDMTVGNYIYGGTLKTNGKSESYVVNNHMIYTEQLREIADYFINNNASINMDNALCVMNMLDTAQRSYISGKCEKKN